MYQLPGILFPEGYVTAGPETVSKLEAQVQAALDELCRRAMDLGAPSGEDLTQPYVLGGFPVPSPSNPAGNPVDFGHPCEGRSSDGRNGNEPV